MFWAQRWTTGRRVGARYMNVSVDRTLTVGREEESRPLKITIRRRNTSLGGQF